MDFVSLFGCLCVVVPTGLGCALCEGRCLISFIPRSRQHPAEGLEPGGPRGGRSVPVGRVSG